MARLRRSAEHETRASREGPAAATSTDAGAVAAGRADGVTIQDVADAAGVSIATVSRVVNSSGTVAPATRAAVLDVVRSLNYVPNNSARGLVRGTTRIVALVFARTPSPGATALAGLRQTPDRAVRLALAIRGAERAAAAADHALVVAGVTPDDVESTLRALTGKVDGAILLDPVVPPEHFEEFARHFPVVGLGARNRPGSAAPAVRVEPAPDNPVPQAVIGPSDATARRIIDTLGQRGMHVPGDAIVTSACSDGLAVPCSPSLTSVHYSIEAAAELAVRSLLDTITGHRQASGAAVPAQLIVGESRGCVGAAIGPSVPPLRGQSPDP